MRDCAWEYCGCQLQGEGGIGECHNRVLVSYMSATGSRLLPEEAGVILQLALSLELVHRRTRTQRKGEHGDCAHACTALNKSYCSAQLDGRV